MDEMTYPMPSNEERLKHLDNPYKQTWSKEPEEEDIEEFPLHIPKEKGNFK